MTTINDWDVVKSIILNDGAYYEDPPVYAVLEYIPDFPGVAASGLEQITPSAICWKLCYSFDQLHQAIVTGNFKEVSMIYPYSQATQWLSRGRKKDIAEGLSPRQRNQQIHRKKQMIELLRACHDRYCGFGKQHQLTW